MAELKRCEWPDCNETKPLFAQLKGWLKNQHIWDIVGEREVHIKWFCPQHKKAVLKLRCNKCGFIHLNFPMNTQNKAMCPKHELSWCAHCLWGVKDFKCPLYNCKEKITPQTYMDTFYRIWEDLIIKDTKHWDAVLLLANNESKNFKTTKIGNQVWMAENLNIKTKDSWFYDDKESNSKYGRLYSLFAAKKTCPDGWRLPSKSDWEELLTHLGGEQDAANKLKMGANSGFEATLAGRRNNYDGSFDGLGEFGAYWGSDGWAISLRQKDNNVNLFRTSDVCFSVRYIKT